MKDRFRDHPSLFESCSAGENPSPQPPVPPTTTPAPTPASLPGKSLDGPASEGMIAILARRLGSYRYVPSCSNRACHALQSFLQNGAVAEVIERWDQITGKDLIHRSSGHVFTGRFAYPTKSGWRVIASGPDGAMRSFWWDDFN